MTIRCISQSRSVVLNLWVTTVGERVTVVLQESSDLMGSQDILRAAIGQPEVGGGRAAIGQL